MNPIMRKKHLELQSGCATRQLSAAWQNSAQREFQPIPFKWGMKLCHAGLLAPVWNLLTVKELTFLLLQLAVHTLQLYLEQNIRTRSNSPDPFCGPVAFSEEDLDTGWGWHKAGGLSCKWWKGILWPCFAWYRDQSLTACNGWWKTAFVDQFSPFNLLIAPPLPWRGKLSQLGRGEEPIMKHEGVVTLESSTVVSDAQGERPEQQAGPVNAMPCDLLQFMICYGMVLDKQEKEYWLTRPWIFVTCLKIMNWDSRHSKYS